VTDNSIELPESQPILDPVTEAAIFLVLTVNAGGEPQARSLLEDLGALKRAVGFRVPEAALSCVVGIGSELWDRMFAGPRPACLHPFSGYAGERHTAPATAGDLLFHIRARRLDLCFELAGLIVQRLAGYVKVVDEVHGFRSFDQRDLLGFVDGTENPDGREAFAAVTVTSEEDPEFAGGSYVIVQKYLHEIASWQALPVPEQEHVIGRTKLDDVELPAAEMPPNSHVALNSLPDANGNEPELLRLNMPFGHVGAGEYGTYFIAYARDPGVIETLLVNMFIGNPPGNYDRILDYSKAITGSLFFVPSADFLSELPEAANATRAAVTAAPAGAPRAAEVSVDEAAADVSTLTENVELISESAAAPDVGSLGIGSLREDHQS
jgi:putative iron-dependent peroxidase